MKGLFPLVLSLILFWGAQKFYIKNRGLKEISPNWHWVGLLPLMFGLLSYIIAITHFVNPWKFQWASWGLLLWVCPLTAVLTGIVFLSSSRNRFVISAIAAWIFNGPLLPALSENNLSLQQFHHLVSAAVLLVILYHLREIWSPKGILFGLAGFYAFVIITVNLSEGVVNLLQPFKESGPPPMWLGIIFAILSIATFLWYKPGFKRAK
ncbi:MAG: hypothetical protein V1756_00935 [Patescibacteria group bacterium]